MARGLRIATFNAAIQDLRLLGRSLYCPVAWPRERLRHLPAALESLDADIVCLQELFHRPMQDWLRDALSPSFPHVAGLQSGSVSLRLGNELLVLSRFPLGVARLHRFGHATREEWIFASKGFLHVQAEIPGLGTVDLVNFHTTAGGARAHPESPEMETIRARQISQILDVVMPLPLTFLIGDLNAGPQTSTHIYKEVVDHGFVDAFLAGGGAGMTWDPANPLVARSRESHLPPQRIDHVFLSGSLAEQLTPRSARLILHEHGAATPDGPMPYSDHYGVLTELKY